MSIPHPIPYQGSKRNLAGSILALFPSKIDRVIEPFAGSAAVSLAAAYYKRAPRFLINDANHALMDLWDHIIHKPKIISARYRRLWEAQRGRERAYYDFVRDRFNRTHKPHYFLYLLARCVKASIRYNSDGDFNQSPDNRRKGTHPDTMTEHILGASQLLSEKTEIFCGDYRKVLECANPGDLVYLDPPYQGVCGNRDQRYFQGVIFDNFIKALQILNDKDVPYILSYDGRTGVKVYGRPMPSRLNLTHIEVDAGRSSQATLLGRNHRTYESLYISPALARHIETKRIATLRNQREQLSFVHPV